MASEARRSHPALRILLGALALLLLLLVLAAGIGVWLLGTESGLRFLLPRVIERADGVQVNGVRGRVTGPLAIDRLVIERPNERIELHDIRLHWQPRALWPDRLLQIDALDARRMILTSRIERVEEPDTGPPTDIGLPLGLRIDRLRLEGGEIRRGPVTVATLAPLELSLRYRDDRYDLELRRFGAAPRFDAGQASAGIQGAMRLNAQHPFAVDGRFTVRSEAEIEERELGVAGQLNLQGSLEDLHALLDLRINDAPLTADLRLHPFSDQLLGAAQARTQGLNLRAFDPALPVTALDLTLDAAPDGSGRLRVHNTAPGALERERVPLQALDLEFHQREGGIDFESIRARLGHRAEARHAGGELAGRGRYADGALQLKLGTDRLNLQGIDPRLRATTLKGSLEARHADGRQHLVLTLSEPFGRDRVSLDGEAVLADAELEIRRAELSAGAGRLHLSGQVALEGKQAFRAEGRFQRFRLHDFGRFDQVPQMNLNGGFTVTGARAPQLQGQLEFDLADSTLGGQPLSGQGRARLEGERLEVPRLHLASGRNRLQIEGALANGDADLNFSLQAPQLGQLGPAFSGALSIEGQARGNLEEPRIHARWSASDARLPGQVRIGSSEGQADVHLDRGAPFMLRAAEAQFNATGVQQEARKLERAQVRVRVSPEPNAPLQVDLDAQGLALDEQQFQRVQVTVDGTSAQHRIDARASQRGQDWLLRAAGGLDSLSANASWEGQLQEFSARGQVEMQTEGQAQLALAQDRQRVQDLTLAINGGRLQLDQFERGPDGMRSRGRIDQLRLDQVLAARAGEQPWQSDLQLSGHWELRYDDALNGNLVLRRDRGDVTVLGNSPVTLGLRTLETELRASGGRIEFDARVAGERLGTIRIDASTRLGHAGNPLALAPDAPLAGTARIEMPSIGWIAGLVTPEVVADGRLQGQVTLGGTVRNPDITGRVDGDALRLAHAEFGLDLRQGTLRSEFRGDQLLVQALSFEGPQGRAQIAGPIDLSERLAADLRLNAERFAVLNRPDRRLVVTGESSIQWRRDMASIRGDFTVNSGFFDIGQADRPTLGEDVIIIGQEDRQARPLATSINVLVRLGDGVTVRGRGLDALLGGRVRLVGEPGQPLQAQGTLSILDGNYSAYGRELAIERGELRFTGPLNNPALDILAMRRGQEVEAGVAVGGTVLAPRVTLVSEPTVPDAEKLAWLVIGRSLANAGAGEIGSLQAAAGALLAQGAAAGVQSGIASAFGLDTFAIGTGTGIDNLEQRIVTIGKQISQRLYVGYQHGLESAAGVLQLRYRLTPALSLEAEAGARSALSLFYNISFD